MAPKTSRAVWEKVRCQFEAGSYTSLKELAESHSINPINLRTKIYREKWTLKRATLENKIAQNIEKKLISSAQVFLNDSQNRVLSYRKMIDATQKQSGSTLEDGTPLLDPETLDVLTRCESRLYEMGRCSHRIASASSVDVTSGGQSIGDIVSAIAKLRESGNAVVFSPEDKAKILECEIESPNTK